MGFPAYSELTEININGSPSKAEQRHSKGKGPACFWEIAMMGTPKAV